MTGQRLATPGSGVIPVVEEFFARMNRHDTAGVLELLGDDASWWIAGDLPLSGSHSKEALGKILSWLFSTAPNLAFTVHGSICEGTRMAVEAESHATTTAGTVYNNRYHFLFDVRDGKVRAGREYYDTMHTARVFLGSASGTSKTEVQDQ